MINNENLDKLSMTFINESKLTTKFLNDLGFNGANITSLINKGYIRRTGWGKYEIAFLNIEFCLDLLHKCLIAAKYNKVFYIIDILYNRGDRDFDVNLYLYLLSFITIIPTKYKECIKHITYSDIQIPMNNTSYNNIEIENIARYSISKNMFIEGVDALKKQDTLSIKDKILITLLEQIIKKQNLSNDNLNKNIVYKIISLLKNNNLKDALSLIRSFLEDYNCSELEFLIVNLIKISILLKDNSFNKVKKVLIFIRDNRFKYNVSDYVKEFYQNLALNNYEVAALYLEILDKANDLGYSCVILKGMHQVLNDSINAHELLQRKNLEDLVLNIHDELEIEQGIKVLDVDEEDINNLLEIIEKYPDMRCSLIEFRGTKKLEIRYHPYVEKYDVNELINMSIETYNRREFQACINCNLRILQVSNEPKDVVYSKIGLSYMRIGEIKKAIDYLIIADYLARKNGLSYNFDSLISKLEKEINVGENFGGRK